MQAAMVTAMVATMVAVMAALVVASMVAVVGGSIASHVLATSPLVSVGGVWWLEHCISDFVAHVLATSSLVPLGGFSGSSKRYVAGGERVAQ
jgi:hypothetical protein